MSRAVHLDGITKRFPGVVANDDVDLAVESGSIHALLGENGAGKTTLMNVLYGLYQPNEGTVYVGEQACEFVSPRDAIDAGVGMIHQHFMLVDTLSIAENIVLGNEPKSMGGLAMNSQRAVEAVRELSDRYGFDVDPEMRVEDASVGVQQRVEILKALYRGADVLILDEPTAVLTPQEVEDLFSVLDELTEQGKTIIFITHKLGEAMHAADDITVLRDGENVGSVTAAETSREELAELMVGREVLLETEKEPNDPGSAVLSVENLHVTDDRGVEQVGGVEFEVRAGEVFGIAGVDGNGQSEVVESITGLRSPDSGRVAFQGTDLTQTTRRERIDEGMAYIPEDRQERGLVMEFDLVENSLLGSQHAAPFTSDRRIDWDHARDHAEDIIEEYDVRPPNADASAESLSGGNQQKFIVGREFSRDPSLVAAAHPTRGVDVGSIEFIHERLLDLRRDDKAILLVSSKLDEVRQLSDRLAVMHDGRIMDVVDPDEVTEEELGLLMAGEQPEDAPSIAGAQSNVESATSVEGGSATTESDSAKTEGESANDEGASDADGDARSIESDATSSGGDSR